MKYFYSFKTIALLLLIFLFSSCDPVKTYSKMQMNKSDLKEGAFKSSDGAKINFADNKNNSKETLLFINSFMMNRLNFSHWLVILEKTIID